MADTTSHHRYLFVASKRRFEATHPSMHLTRFDPILDDLHLHSPIKSSLGRVLLAIFVTFLVAAVVSIVQVVAFKVAVAAWLAVSVTLLAVQVCRGAKKDELARQMRSYMENHKIMYENLLKDVGFSFGYSMSWNGRELEGHIEFIQSEDIIQDVHKTEDSQLDISGMSDRI